MKSKVSIFKKYITVVALVIVGPLTSLGQNIFDVGMGAGTSTLWGDIHELKLMKSVGYGLEATGRYALDSRFGVRANFRYMNAKGYGYVDYPTGGDLDSRGYVYDKSVDMLSFALLLEMNWSEFDLELVGKAFTPHVALGLGAISSLGVEGAYFPIIAGCKYELTEQFYISGELFVMKTLKDYYDGVNDPYGIGQDSYISNNDWFGGVNVGIHYRINSRCRTCPKFLDN